MAIRQRQLHPAVVKLYINYTQYKKLKGEQTGKIYKQNLFGDHKKQK